MRWLPLGLLMVPLILTEARTLSGAQGGWMGIALPLVFSASALWLPGAFFLSTDMLRAFNAGNQGLNRPISRRSARWVMCRWCSPPRCKAASPTWPACRPLRADTERWGALARAGGARME